MMSANGNGRRIHNPQLVALRTLGGYPTRSAVARAAGISDATCGRIETGDRAVRLESLGAYARVLGIELDELAMLRQPAGQGQLFLSARVVVLPVAVWEEVDAQANCRSEAFHFTIARQLQASGRFVEAVK